MAILGARELTTDTTIPPDIQRLVRLSPHAPRFPAAMRAFDVLGQALATLHAARDLADIVLNMLDDVDEAPSGGGC